MIKSPSNPLPRKGAVLIVDDEASLRDLIAIQLNRDGFKTVSACNAETAWSFLQQNGEGVDAILLDKKMPGINGFELLERIKKAPSLSQIPVIMLTGAAETDDMLRGIQAGAYYFLTKPFQKGVLAALVASAINEKENYRSLLSATRDVENVVRHLDYGKFRFQTIDEANHLAAMIAHACPTHETLVLGLSELFINAVEHGNLGITYDEKTALLHGNRLDEEISERLKLPENISKYVVAIFEKEPENVTIRVKDSGPGFNWRPYMDFDTERLTHIHGRGIAMANKTVFSSLQYLGSGNELVATI